MRQTIKTFVLALCSLVLFASCTENVINTTILKKVSIRANNNLITKTFLGADNSIHWIDGKDILKVFETVDDETNVIDTEPCLIIDNQGLFEFTIEERYSATGNYYNAFYPASAWVSGNTDITQMTLNLISTQSPTTTSFDPEADILIAKTLHTEIPTDLLDMQFKRIVAISRMGITNLNTEDNILSVKFSAENRNLSGNLKVDLSQGGAYNYGADKARDYVTATYSELDGFTNGSTAVFTLFPTKFNVGEKFTIEICTSSKRYTKTFTLQESQKLEFKAGDISTFNVNMTGAKEEAINAVSNQFFIVAKHKDTYYAMSSEAGDKRLLNQVVTLTDGKVNSTDAKLIWTIVNQANGNVLISQNENYLYSIAAKTISLSSTQIEYKLKENDDGTYRIANPAVENLELRLNGNENPTFFRFYTSATDAGMIGDMLIIPAGGEPIITKLATPTGLSAVVDAIDPQKINITWNAVPNATSYIVKCGSQNKEVNSTSTSFEGLAIGTHSIKVSACGSGYKTSDEANTSCTVTGIVAGGDDVIFTDIAISKKSNSSLSVYIYGANFDRAQNMTVYCESTKGQLSENATINNSSFGSATISSLVPGTEYTIYVTANDGEKTVKSETKKYTISESEAAASKGWLELPAQSSIANTKEYALYAGERNYSFLFDTKTRSSLWVAYPLAKGHMASGRSDSWTYCPDVPKENQQVLKKGYTYTGEQVSRGHQIANSDRNGIPAMQKQTFYYTNSTPQLQNKFNGGIWNKLEQAIQSEAKSISDTVYVVTGPVYQTVGGNESVDWGKAKDNDGKACPIPNYYFKVVMKVHRSGSFITDASAVGFWFVHKNYSDSFTNYAVSVDQIESLTGFDFYANLPEEIEAKAEKNTDWDKFLAF